MRWKMKVMHAVRCTVLSLTCSVVLDIVIRINVQKRLGALVHLQRAYIAVRR